MTMDGFVISALQHELTQIALPARVNRIYQPSPRNILFVLRQPGKTLHLLLSSHPRLARVHLAEKVRENPPSPPPFCLLLRKYLEGSRLVAIARPGFERILEFYFNTRSELGDPVQRVLVLEIMGKHSNIILRKAADGEILDSIRHVTPSMSSYRQILPGHPYIPPPPQDKKDPRQVRELTFYSYLQTENKSLPTSLVRAFAGLSPLLARELVHRAGLNAAAVPADLDRQQLRALWQVFSQVVRCIEDKTWEPTVVLDQRGDPVAFSIIPLSHYEGNQQLACTSINEAVALFYHHLEIQEAVAAQKHKLQSLIGKETKRLEKTISRQESTLQSLEENERFRHLGELLTANLFRVSPGDQVIEVQDFYSPTGETIAIPLDPGLSPAANAQQYFKRYRKGKKGRPHLEQQLARNRDELNYLEGTALALADAVSQEEIAEIERELSAQGYGSKPTGEKKRVCKPSKGAAAPRPLTYRSRDGFKIFVGRNNRQNDYLTRRLAKEDDYWFHAKDIPGSHVIVRCPTKATPPDTTLEDAALLAAYYSKGRSSSQVAVDYTRAKNVRKPRGARPGMVIYEQHRTIFVTPRWEEIETLPGEKWEGPV